MNSYDREAGRTPVQRNTFYEPIKVLADGHQPPATEAEWPSGKSKVLEDTRRLVLSMLAPNPAERPASYEDLRKSLVGAFRRTQSFFSRFF
jgi:hypothetical protein